MRFSIFNPSEAPSELHGGMSFWSKSFAILASLAAVTALAQPADGSLRWKYTTLSSAAAGSILSSPAVGPDGTVYIGTEIGSSATPSSNSGILYAFNSDGTVKWQFQAGDWIDSSPTVTPDGKTVYFGSWDGNLYALNSDGTRKWSYATGGYITSSPALGTDGTVYVGSSDGFLYAINPDGTQKWTAALVGKIESSPAIGPDGTIYVGASDNALHAVSSGGTQLWAYAATSDIVGSPAIAADGTVYFGSLDGNLYALNATGQLKWSFATANAIDASPSLGADGTIYIGSTSGRLYAVTQAGAQKWTYPAAAAAALQPIYSTVAVRADGSLVVGTSNNEVLCLNADGTLRWTTPLGDWADSSPVVDLNGDIYIGCYDKAIYALSGTPPAVYTDWAQYRRDPQHLAWTPLGVVAGGTGQLTALSVRANPGTGDGAMVAGYIVTGSGSRSLLIRAVGPTLANYTLTGVMPDPLLTVYDGSAAVLATNDNWGSAANAAQIVSTAATLGDFALPTGSLDSALLANFSSGLYTAYPLGTGRQTGVVLLETYDAGGTAGTYLSGLSTRDQVGTGSNILVAGFILSNGPRTLLIRGVGPTLGDFLKSASNPTPAVLQDPMIQLYSHTSLIAENNDWGTSSNPAQIAATAATVGDFALDAGSKDAAMIVTLPAGLYTVQLTGANQTTGAGIIEVYLVP